MASLMMWIEDIHFSQGNFSIKYPAVNTKSERPTWKIRRIREEKSRKKNIHYMKMEYIIFTFGAHKRLCRDGEREIKRNKGGGRDRERDRELRREKKIL